MPLDKSSINLINAFSPSEILEDENFGLIKDIGARLYENLDFDTALEFSNKLDSLLNQLSPSSDKEWKRVEVLKRWVYQLKLLAFGNLNAREKLTIFKQDIAEILLLGLDVREAVFNYLNLFSDGEIYKTETQSYLLSLQSSQAVLGSKTNEFNKVNFKPTVANWLKEYQASLRNKNAAQDNNGAFFVINFFNTNPYVKFLENIEQDALRQLFELFDWLVDPIVYTDQPDSPTEASYISQQNFRLPAELSNKQTPPTVPIAPNSNSLFKVKLENISRQKNTNFPKQSQSSFYPSQAEKDKNAKTTPSKAELLLQKQIDKKLDELKNKAKQNK